MKKVIALLLTLVMVFALCGCSKTENEPQTQAIIMVPATTTEAPIETEDFDENGFGEKELDEPIILIDCNSAKVSATAVFKEPVSFGSEYYIVGYRLLVENKTSKYIMVNVNHTSLDGFMVNAYTQETQVAPGKKAIGKVYVQQIDMPSLKTVEDMANFEGTISVFANDNGGMSYTGTGETAEFCLP